MASNKATGKITIDIKVITEGAERASGALQKLGNSVQKISASGTSVNKLGKAVEVLGRAAGQAGPLMEKVLGSQKGGGQKQATDTEKMAAGLQRAVQAIGEVEKSSEGLMKTMENIGGFSKELKGLPEFVGKFSSNLGKLGGTASSAGASVAGASAASGGLSAALGSVASVLAPVLAALAALLIIILPIIIAFKAFKMALKGAQAVMRAWTKNLEEIKQKTVELRQALGRAVDGLRQFTQGLLSVGRAITFFVSIPLTAFIKEATEAALDFEQQMARVQKVTSMSGPQIETLNRFIRDLGNVSVVSTDTLSMFAEQIGQLGIHDTSSMQNYLMLFEMFTVAADIGAERIVFAMGKIANAFGKMDGSDEALDWMASLMSAFNDLENNAAVTAASLVTTFSDITSEAAMLKAHPAALAAWATILQEQGMSANEAGTALKRLTTGAIEYADQLLEITVVSERWADEQAFLQDLNDDFIGTIGELASVIGEEETAVAQISAAYEGLEKRGGSALAKLINSMKRTEEGTSRYAEVMEIAMDAWGDTSGLMREYDIMAASTSAQTNKLKNVMQDTALTIGDSVLPAINDLIGFVAPAISALGQIFAGLSEKTRRMILGVIAFTAVIGPMSFFVNQVAFGFVMAAQGLAKMLAVIPAAVSWFGSLLKGMMMMNPVALMVGAAVLFAVNNIRNGVGGITVFVQNAVKTLTGKMKTWGKNLFDSFADGIEASSARIIKAIKQVIDIFVAFFKSFSPPKRGPLSEIDVWGENLFKTYLEGFASADFDILNNIGSKVEDILSSFHFRPGGDDDAEERKGVVGSLIGFREGLSKLLSDFRKFGSVSEAAIDSLVKGFGSAADEIKELIQATLKYEKLLEQIRDIEKAKKNTVKAYQAEEDAVVSSALSAEEQVEALANAQWIRDTTLSQLEEEQRLLEEEADAAKEQLEWQNKFTDALQDQADLLQELLEVIEDMAGGMSDLVGNLEGLGGIDPKDVIGDADGIFAQATKRMEEFQIEIMRVKIALVTTFMTAAGILDVFWKALKGDTEGVDKALENFDTIEERVWDFLNLDTEMENATPAMRDAIKGMFAFNDEELLEAMPDDVASRFLEGIIPTEEEFASQLSDAGKGLATGIAEMLATVREDAGPIISEFWSGLTGGESLAGDEGSFFFNIGSTIGEIADAFGKHGPTILGHLSTIGGQIWNFVGGLLGVTDATGVEPILGKIAEGLGKIAENETVPKVLNGVWIALRIIWWIGAQVARVMIGLGLAGLSFVNAWLIVLSVFEWFARVLASPLQLISWLVLKLGELLNLGGEAPTWAEHWDGFFKTLTGGAADALTEFLNFGTKGGEAIDGLKTGADELRAGMADAFTGIDEDVHFTGKMLEDDLDAAGKLLTDFGVDNSEALAPLSSNISLVGSEFELLAQNLPSFVPTVQDELTGLTEQQTTGFEGMMLMIGGAAGQISSLPEIAQTAAGAMVGITIPAPIVERIPQPWWVRFVKGGVFVMPSGVPGGGGLPTGSSGEHPPTAQGGGPVFGPTLIGEGGKPELFNFTEPGHVTSHGLSRTLAQSLEGFSGEGGGGDINININNPSVRDDRDIDVLADTIAKRIAERAQNRGRF